MKNSGNPVFNKVNNLSQASDEVVRTEENGEINIVNATYLGVGLKILHFLGITIMAAFGGILLMSIAPTLYLYFLIASIFTGFISAIIAMNSFKLSFFFGTLYCVGEGMCLGVVSMLVEMVYPGIVISIVAATLAVVVGVGLLFVTGLVKVNNKFYKFMLTLSFGFVLAMLMLGILSLCGLIDGSNFLLNMLVAFISLFIASLCLLSDMEQAYQLVNCGGPKDCEWMVAFGISYTVLWIYIQILRIAVIILANSRRD